MNDKIAIGAAIFRQFSAHHAIGNNQNKFTKVTQIVTHRWLFDHLARR